MERRDEGDMIGNDGLWRPATGALAMALLFGSVATAMALILSPIAERLLGPQIAAVDRLDRTVTGSTPIQDAYTIRRSVLQPSPESVCVIRADGLRSGAC